MTVSEFAEHLTAHLHVIRAQLRAGTYKFSVLRAVAVPKGPGTYRPILIPTVSDRVVQRSLLTAISAAIEPSIAFDHSYAFRRGLGVKDAVRALMKAVATERKFVLVVDIKSFFPTVDAQKLLDQLNALLPDNSISPLLAQLFAWEIGDLSAMPELKRECFPHASEGLPQGSLLSPTLSNLYLAPFDEVMRSSGRVFMRYADDLAVVCDTRAEAETALEFMRSHLLARGLELPRPGEKKCKIWDYATGGVEYLGFYVRSKGKTPVAKPSEGRMRNALDTVSEWCDPRTPHTLGKRFDGLSSFVAGWLAAFAQVADVTRERDRLLQHAQEGLSALLVDRGLLPRANGLTTKQRQFLSIDELIARVPEPPRRGRTRQSTEGLNNRR